MIYFKVLKYPLFIFEVNLKYFGLGSKRYLASNFNIDFLSLKKCRLSRKRILGDDLKWSPYIFFVVFASMAIMQAPGDCNSRL